MRDRQGFIDRTEWRIGSLGKTVSVSVLDGYTGYTFHATTPKEARQLDRYADALKEAARFLDPDLGSTEVDTRDTLAKVLEALEDGGLFVSRGSERGKALAALEALRGLGLTVPELTSGPTSQDKEG
jgi:hypothetical protein